jgi:insertion element IS1 protein InsB
MSFSMIGRVLGVSDVAVLKWVRTEAASVPEPVVSPSVVTVEMDEMWHFLKKNSAKLWVWRAYDVDTRRTVAWVLGAHDDVTCRRLIDKVGVKGKTFVTDDWEGYHRVIPEGQLFTGKDLTFPTEQDNSNLRHSLARFRRRTKGVSKCCTMVDRLLRRLHHLQHPTAFAAYAKRVAAIFG